MKSFMFLGIVVFYNCLMYGFSLPSLEKIPTLIKTNNGMVRGKISENGKAQVFLGIPYAKPPLGELRFQRPQPANSWDDVFDASSLSLDCQQFAMPPLPMVKKFGMAPPYSEDCLKLNIWVPREANNPKKIPVLLSINYGGFATGGTRASILQGETLAVEENVIVVTFNYRVASLGFLYLDHPEAPGNVGLLDQVMAMQWVKDNIAEFGGDPEEITLMGSSAGGVSVLYHYLSPLSQHLFKRGISQSGVPNRFYAYQTKEGLLERAKLLGENLQCPTGLENKTDFIRCLRNFDAQELIRNEPRPGNNDLDMFVFSSVLDGYFFPESPFELLRKNAFKKAEIMIGNNKDEASIFLMMFNPLIFNPFFLSAPITTNDIIGTFRGKATFSKDTVELMESMYLEPPNSLMNNITSGVRVITDYAFTCPSKEWEMGMAKNPLYKYLYAHRSPKSKFPEWFGAFHSAELQYVFGEPIYKPDEYTKEDIQFSRRIMRHWANFARTGNPNLSPDGIKDEYTHWPKFTTEKQEYLVLDSNNSRVEQFHRHKECGVILKTIPKIDKYSARKAKDCSKQEQ